MKSLSCLPAFLPSSSALGIIQPRCAGNGACRAWVSHLSAIWLGATHVRRPTGSAFGRVRGNNVSALIFRVTQLNPTNWERFPGKYLGRQESRKAGKSTREVLQK